MSADLLSIIIPAYNEEKTISLILGKVSEVELIGGFQKEIIVVNDFSKDRTVEAVEQFCAANPEVNIRLFHQPVLTFISEDETINVGVYSHERI